MTPFACCTLQLICDQPIWHDEYIDVSLQSFFAAKRGRIPSRSRTLFRWAETRVPSLPTFQPWEWRRSVYFNFTPRQHTARPPLVLSSLISAFMANFGRPAARMRTAVSLSPRRYKKTNLAAAAESASSIPISDHPLSLLLFSRMLAGCAGDDGIAAEAEDA